MDAAARGVSLQIPKAIGGAGVEAEAAVDALCEVFVGRVLAGDGGDGCHFGTAGNGSMGEGRAVRAVWFRVSFDKGGCTPVNFSRSLEVADSSRFMKMRELDLQEEFGSD